MSNENNSGKTKILLPKVDVIFKLLFGDKRNIEILTDFLKSVLNISEDEYEKITIEDTHLKRETVDDKLGIVDVKLTTKSGTIVHIEIQIAQESTLPKRITYYNAKMLVTQLKSSEDYYKLEKVITIAIADFNFIKDSDEYHHVFELREKSKGIRLTDIIEINKSICEQRRLNIGTYYVRAFLEMTIFGTDGREIRYSRTDNAEGIDMNSFDGANERVDRQLLQMIGELFN